MAVLLFNTVISKKKNKKTEINKKNNTASYNTVLSKACNGVRFLKNTFSKKSTAFTVDWSRKNTKVAFSLLWVPGSGFHR